MEILNNYIVQLGAIGLIILGLVWFAKTMLQMFIENFKETELQIKDKTTETSKLEKEFRVFLQDAFAKNQQIVKENSEAFRELSSAIYTQTAYLESVNNKIKQ